MAQYVREGQERRKGKGWHVWYLHDICRLGCSVFQCSLSMLCSVLYSEKISALCRLRSSVFLCLVHKNFLHYMALTSKSIMTVEVKHIIRRFYIKYLVDIDFVILNLCNDFIQVVRKYPDSPSYSDINWKVQTNEVPHCGTFSNPNSHPSWAQIFASGFCFQILLACIPPLI